MVRLPRRQLARYVAEQLAKGNDGIVAELAALLVDEGRQREAEILVRDIEAQLADIGELIVTVEVAHALDADTKQQIGLMFPGKKVQFRQVINPELIGGCRITTPTQMLDASLQKQLIALKTVKI